MDVILVLFQGSLVALSRDLRSDKRKVLFFPRLSPKFHGIIFFRPHENELINIAISTTNLGTQSS